MKDCMIEKLKKQNCSHFETSNKNDRDQDRHRCHNCDLDDTLQEIVKKDKIKSQELDRKQSQ